MVALRVSSRIFILDIDGITCSPDGFSARQSSRQYRNRRLRTYCLRGISEDPVVKTLQGGTDSNPWMNLRSYYVKNKIKLKRSLHYLHPHVVQAFRICFEFGKLQRMTIYVIVGLSPIWQMLCCHWAWPSCWVMDSSLLGHRVVVVPLMPPGKQWVSWIAGL